jgi:hypothetical protein
MVQWQQRLKAASIQFGLSVTVAAMAAALVFGLWYPYPYREISGGRELFTLLVTVDVILGPLLTFAIFNRAKPMSDLRRDLAVVALLQLAGLGYGLWTVFEARPVHLVFEIDRFRVVHAIDVPEDLLPKAPQGIVALPLTGPTLLAVRPFVDEAEKTSATLAALQGVSLSSRPDLWRDYDAARPDVLKAAKLVADLKRRFPKRAAEIDAALKGVAGADTAMYVPMAGRKSFWTVFVDSTRAQPLAFMPLDSF